MANALEDKVIILKGSLAHQSGTLVQCVEDSNECLVQLEDGVTLVTVPEDYITGGI